MKGNKKHINQLVLVSTVTLILVLVFKYAKEKGIFVSKTKLYAYLDEPAGISTKSIVQLNGFEIGKVNYLELVNNEILLELIIDSKIKIKTEAQFFSKPKGLLGEKYIDVQNSNQGQGTYSDGDTLYNKIISVSLTESLDPIYEYEPELKELSKTIGTALLDYANSPNENCNESQLKFVSNRVENFPDELNEQDAYILIENTCRQNTEYSQIQNELIFKVLEINPTPIINILTHNNLKKSIINEFHSIVESPINDEFNIEGIIKKVEAKEQSIGKQKLLKSLQLAIKRYK